MFLGSYPMVAERHCTLNTTSGVIIAPKWMVALIEFRLDLENNLFSKPAISIKAGWKIGTHIDHFPRI